jgi:hypothetical protein
LHHIKRLYVLPVRRHRVRSDRVGILAIRRTRRGRTTRAAAARRLRLVAMKEAAMFPSPASLLFVALLTATAPPTPRSRQDRPSGTCDAGETGVVVDTTAHRLHLCERGAVKARFAVALGMNGVDKRRTGDNRTPLGIYPLGTPRASASFHRFVPVAYPTPAQARAGLTGSAIGIHGPPRGLDGIARLQALVATDWTAGCIAVATDDDIEAIVRWLDTRNVRIVRLVRAAGA